MATKFFLNNIFIQVVLLLTLYYGLIILTLVYDFPQKQETILNNRLGTILFNSINSQNTAKEILVGHIYCYYPKKQALTTDQTGEYVLKKVERIEDCRDWYGVVVKYENPSMSEKNMLERFGT